VQKTRYVGKFDKLADYPNEAEGNMPATEGVLCAEIVGSVVNLPSAQRGVCMLRIECEGKIRRQDQMCRLKIYAMTNRKIYVQCAIIRQLSQLYIDVIVSLNENLRESTLNKLKFQGSWAIGYMFWLTRIKCE
jgi:hypothetical protein